MTVSSTPPLKRHEENLLFLKRVIRNPRKLGALLPSSQALGELICRHVECSAGDIIVEVGAGTGRLTRQLLKAGIPREKLWIIELDEVLATFLKNQMPEMNIIQGDARDLPSLLPSDLVGKVATIISGIPMVNLSFKTQKEIINGLFQVMKPGGSILQFTYGPRSPLPARKLGIEKVRIGRVLLNFPPAVVWKYTQNQSPIDLSFDNRDLTTLPQAS